MSHKERRAGKIGEEGGGRGALKKRGVSLFLSSITVSKVMLLHDFFADLHYFLLVFFVFRRHDLVLFNLIDM